MREVRLELELLERKKSQIDSIMKQIMKRTDGVSLFHDATGKANVIDRRTGRRVNEKILGLEASDYQNMGSDEDDDELDDNEQDFFDEDEEEDFEEDLVHSEDEDGSDS